MVCYIAGLWWFNDALIAVAVEIAAEHSRQHTAARWPSPSFSCILQHLAGIVPPITRLPSENLAESGSASQQSALVV